MPFSANIRPVFDLSASMKKAQVPCSGAGKLAIIAIATTTLLGACSFSPRSLTTESEPVAVQVAPVQQAQPEPAAPIVSQPSVVAASGVAVSTPVATPTPLEPKPEAKPAAVAEWKTTATPPAVAAPAKAVPDAVPAASPAARAAPATQSGPLAKGFYINVGLFAVPANGAKAQQKLEDAGLPVIADAVENKKGKLTRVRVGPYATRAQAGAAAKKIHALKLDAVVFKR